jgi:spermidine synthase
VVGGGPPRRRHLRTDLSLRAPFEELASHETRTGLLSLRRRFEPVRRVDVFEVKLGDEFLMSSLFTVAEIELARLALVELPGDELEVVVGGLGLGYTARAALQDPRVRSLVVVEALPEVIAWHERGLLPEVAGLAAEPGCRLVHGDFFALAGGEVGFDLRMPGRCFDAILLDIDHTPRHLLDACHEPFYTVEGLARLRRFLREGGVFALWSDDPPDAEFLAVLEEVFTIAAAHVVSFPNFYTGAESTNTVYVSS